MLILETLAAVIPGGGIDMTELLLKGRYLTNGISCLYFTPDSTGLSEIIFYLKSVPVKFVCSEFSKTEKTPGNIIHIDDFFIDEERTV